MTKLVVGSATDVGLVRSNNQDQYLVAPGLYAVADGMGGHAAGEVASQTAIEALRDAFAVAAHTAEGLAGAAKTANRAVWDQARANRGMLGMGTTLVALAVVEENDGHGSLAIAHVGDSRAYLHRDGSLHQLTTDHSLVQELVDDGQITPAQATIHPQRHVLTRALGVEPSVGVDLLRAAPQNGDRYLLCSDGLPREASDEQIAAVLTRFKDPSEAAKELVALANSKGGSDNVTVVVVDVMANDPTGETLVVVPGVPPGPAPRQAPKHEPAPARDPGRRPPRRGRPARRGRTAPRPVTLRVIGFLVAICVVLGGAIAGLAWYARSTYYVGLDHGHITIFQGRPGGVLWFGATVVQRTRYTTKSVLAYEARSLVPGYLEPSKQASERYVAGMVARKRAAVAASRPATTVTTKAPVTKAPTTTRPASTVANTAKTVPSTTTTPVTTAPARATVPTAK